MKKIMILFVAIFLVSMSLASAYDLEVVSIQTTGNLVADSNITFDIQVQNNEGLYNVSKGQVNLTFDYGGPTIIPDEFELDKNLTAGENTTFHVTKQYNSKGTYNAIASLVGLTNDTNPSNDNLTETVVILNTAPAVDAIADQEVIQGKNFTYQVEATDSDGDSLTYYIDSSDLGNDITISATGLIEFPNTYFFDHTITVTVSDGEENSTVSFVLSVVEDSASFEFVDTTIEMGGDNQERGVETETFFVIKNTGTQPISNFEFTDNLNNDFLAKVTFANTVLGVGEQRQGRLTITVPEDQDSKRVKIGKLSVKAEGTTENITTNIDTYLEAESLLAITNINIKTETEQDKSVKEDDNVDFFKENDEVEMVVTVENLYDENEDADIKNTYVKVSPHRDEWFDNEESDDVRIYSGSEKDITLNFKLSDKIDYDTTTVLVEAYGKDENDDFEHYDAWEITFEIDRASHEISIKSAEIVTNDLYGGNYDVQYLSCQQSQAVIEVNLKNIGTHDEDNVLLRVFSEKSDLDFSKSFTNIDLKEREEGTYKATFTIPSDLKVDGLYYYTVQAYYDGDKESDKESVLVKYICPSDEPNTITPPTTPPTVIIPIDDNTDVGQIQSEPVGKLKAFYGSTGYLVALAIVFIVVLAIVVGLAGTLIGKKK